MMAVVDGFEGTVIFEPGEDLCRQGEERMKEELEVLRLLKNLKGKENMTPGGRKIDICANIGNVSDIDSVLENDAGGIGLFRSEFLYLGRNDPPLKKNNLETPAAVMISDELAEMVDFLSIGTNDLTQYTLALDRQNENLCDFYDPHHKAILKMIRIVADHAHAHGKWVGICGELGGNPELTEEFMRMGIDELSVAPSMVLKLRKIVRGMKEY